MEKAPAGYLLFPPERPKPSPKIFLGPGSPCASKGPGKPQRTRPPIPAIQPGTAANGHCPLPKRRETQRPRTGSKKRRQKGRWPTGPTQAAEKSPGTAKRGSPGPPPLPGRKIATAITWPLIGTACQRKKGRARFPCKRARSPCRGPAGRRSRHLGFRYAGFPP